jgi:hypothetical protein
LISNERNGLVGFNANGDRRMTILADGKVGIGTATPTERLQINSPNTDSLTHYTNTTTGSANTDGFYVGSIGADAYLLNKESSNMFFRTADLERMRISGGGLVGINETSPSAQLQVKSGATNRVPLIVDTLASHAEQIQLFRVNGASVASVGPNGYFVGSGFHNFTSFNNALIATSTTGTSITRNVADGNHALVVNLANTSSTGDIARFHFGGSTKSYVAKDGGFYKNETKLTLNEPTFTLSSGTYFYDITTAQINDNDVIEIVKSASANSQTYIVRVPNNSKQVRIWFRLKPDVYTSIFGGIDTVKVANEFVVMIYNPETIYSAQGDYSSTNSYMLNDTGYSTMYENRNGTQKYLIATSETDI